MERTRIGREADEFRPILHLRALNGRQHKFRAIPNRMTRMNSNLTRAISLVLNLIADFIPVVPRCGALRLDPQRPPGQVQLVVHHHELAHFDAVLFPSAARAMCR